MASQTPEDVHIHHCMLLEFHKDSNTTDGTKIFTMFTRGNCGGGDRGRVAIYRPFGELRRAKIVLSPVWCSRPTTGVPLAHATMNFVGLDLTTSDRKGVILQHDNAAQEQRWKKLMGWGGREGKESVEDDKRSGRPQISCTTEFCGGTFTSICNPAHPIALPVSAPPALFQLVLTPPSSRADITASTALPVMEHDRPSNNAVAIYIYNIDNYMSR
ncbi:hypothetical protein TNCV_425111 [Trichonephila clavipes]|nr:hypothetical protein TNCV_425111 [Trichonephila clavipes]